MDQYLSQVALLRVQNDQRTLGDICMRVHLGIYAATASALETDRAACCGIGRLCVLVPIDAVQRQAEP